MKKLPKIRRLEVPEAQAHREWHKWVYGGQRNPILDGKYKKEK